MNAIKNALRYGIAGLFGAVFIVAIQSIKESSKPVCQCLGWKIAFGITALLLLAAIGYIVYKEFFE